MKRLNIYLAGACKGLVDEGTSGKSSIERELIALGFNKIVTYTTRPMRKKM